MAAFGNVHLMGCHALPSRTPSSPDCHMLPTRLSVPTGDISRDEKKTR